MCLKAPWREEKCFHFSRRCENYPKTITKSFISVKKELCGHQSKIHCERFLPNKPPGLDFIDLGRQGYSFSAILQKYKYSVSMKEIPSH
jgi:hypothetical protein